MSAEPCKVCGEETGIGSPRYFDRRVADLPGDGARVFVCDECASAMRWNAGDVLGGAEWSRLRGTATASYLRSRATGW